MGAFDGISNWVKSQWHGYDVAAQKKKDEEIKRQTDATVRRAYQRQATPQAKKQLLARAVENERDKSWAQLPNGVYVQPNSQNNLNAFSQAAATNIVYNNPLSPKAWANWYNSGREYLGTVTGNDAMRDAGTRGLQERRNIESFNMGQARDSKAVSAGNAVGSVINAGTLASTPVFRAAPSATGVARAVPYIGQGAFSAARYGVGDAADTSYAIRNAGGGRMAQSIGGGVNGLISTALGVYGLGEMFGGGVKEGVKQTTKQAIKQVFKSANLEGSEEVFQSIVDDAVARSTYAPDRPWQESVQNAVAAYMGGAAGGGVFAGVNARYGVGKTEQEGKQQAKQDIDKINSEINYGKVRENRIKKEQRLNTITAQKNEANKNGNKIEYARLSKVENDLKSEVARLKKRENLLKSRLGLSMELTNDAELNAQNNTVNNQLNVQDSKTLSQTNDTTGKAMSVDPQTPQTPKRSQLSGRAVDVPSVSLDKNGTVRISPQQTAQVQTTPSNTLNTQQEGKLKVATTPKNQYPAFSLKESPNAPSVPSNKEIGNMLMAADNGEFTNQDAEMQPDWEAPARNPKSNSTRKLVEQIGNDNKLTEMAREAQMNGEQLNFYAKKDDNGRSVGIEQFDPDNMRIEAGFVIDNNTEKVLGNHIRVDETGISVNVGGREVNTDSIVGNPQDWEGNYRVTETMDRNLKRLAPNEQVYRRTRDFVIGHKTKQEASFREELRAERQSLRERAKTVNNARPRSVSKTEYKEDIFNYIEGNLSKKDLNSKYDKQTVAIIEQYKKDTRAIYDNLLDRVNEVYARFGEEQVPRRQNYLTHINELMNKPSFAGELYGRLQNSFLGEGQQTTRGAVPASIEGRTENFKPSKKWNRFFQQRKGGEFTKDPFAAVDAYLEPALYNIYMTESAVRARALEATFRTADEVRKMDKKYLQENLAEELQKYAGSENKGLVAGLAEYANALTGKTQRLDRQVIDMSPASSAALRGWQQLQRIGGRATVLANASSIVSQSLNQPLAISDAGVINYTKGLVKGIAGKTPIDQSPFIRARQTNVASPYRSNFDKATDVLGVPLQVVELAFVKQTWNAEYEAAVSDGFKGQEAIMEADRRTEQVVAGRGLADKPEVYRSTVANGLLQYTLEVSATNKKFWQDLSVGQKAEFMAATWAMNNLVGLITGFEPLPDFLDAAIESITSFFDSEDERSAKDKAIGTAQRFAGETVSMNPQATAAANIFLDQSQREKLFGSDADISRFEGTAAPVQVIRNIVQGADSANKAINAETTEEQQGQMLNATKSFLKVLPAGNQAQKTLTGVLMNQRGYNIDSSGNPTYAAPDNPLGKTQAAVFGPSSTKEARNYYDNDGSSITSASAQNSINTSSDPRSTVNSIQTTKAENKASVKTSPEGTIKISGVTEKNDSGDYISMDKYKAVQYLQDLDEGEMNNIQKFDNKELKQAIKEVSDEGKLELTNRNIPTDNIKFDSRFAKEYANFEDSIADTNAIDKADKTNNFLKDTVKSQLSDIEKEIFGLSEEDLISYYESETINDQNIENALRVESILYDAGLIDKEGLHRKLDLDARGYKSSKSSKTKTALKNAISIATANTPNLPAFKLSGTKAPQAKLRIPSVNTGNISAKGRQYTVKTKKLA